jgi:hypothetical protein
MEKASGGSFALTTRKRPRTKDDDEDEEDWDMTLYTYKRGPLLAYANPFFQQS